MSSIFVEGIGGFTPYFNRLLTWVVSNFDHTCLDLGENCSSLPSEILSAVSEHALMRGANFLFLARGFLILAENICRFWRRPMPL